LNIKHGECFAEKESDTFEESIDECVKALEKQLVKTKEKIRAK
jgi:putative sigma-54 modulation protein